ncbi:MAG TPA: trypco2 family protein [Pyrinomonadaceae bacterium]|jgi:hypothetical protein
MMDEHHTEDSGTDIPLAETLQTLRRELQLAQLQSVGEGILFEMDKIELELQVVISRRAKGEGGIQFYVVKAGGEVERANETTHTVKLTLTPMSDESGKRLRVSSHTTQGPSRS